ncbi:unnamed protein product [Durusdinium trenchii]|uniref:Uncharacterized protein n=1 Tax=Durusdinium trenchii TaxID=1381693 RepID=A0ABP0M5V7_9DINO
MTPCAPTAGHENEATGREAADSEERDGGDTVPSAVPSALGQSHRVEKPGVAWCEDITARKLALVQRYAAAAKLQAKAEKIEEEWRQSHRVKQKEARRNHEEEALERERLRLERRLQEEQRALGERALREQQQLMHQHERRKERLVLRQQKVWKCVGSGSLEEALKQAAGRRSDARKAKRPASAPDRGRPRGGR